MPRWFCNLAHQPAGAKTTRLLNWLGERSRERGIDPVLVSRLGELLKRKGVEAIEHNATRQERRDLFMINHGDARSEMSTAAPIDAVFTYLTNLDQLKPLVAYVRKHKGEWQVLESGGHMIFFPRGTTQICLSRPTNRVTIYRIRFPDGATLEHRTTIHESIPLRSKWTMLLRESQLRLPSGQEEQPYSRDGIPEGSMHRE